MCIFYLLHNMIWHRMEWDDTMRCERNFWPAGYLLIVMHLVSLSAGWLSWFGNSLVIFVLYRQRASLQPTDFLTLNLAISDASISVFGYSRGILEIFNIFRDDGYLITWIWTCQVKSMTRIVESSLFLIIYILPSLYLLICLGCYNYQRFCIYCL